MNAYLIALIAAVVLTIAMDYYCIVKSGMTLKQAAAAYKAAYVEQCATLGARSARQAIGVLIAAKVLSVSVVFALFAILIAITHVVKGA